VVQIQFTPPEKTGMTGIFKTFGFTIKNPPLWLRQGVKFLIVGALNTGVDLGIYLALTRGLTFFAGNLVFAKGISYTAGILNSFFWNRAWTFQMRDLPWARLAPFILTNLVGLGINSLVLQVSLHSLALPEIVSLTLATGAALAWNFLTSKFVVFRSK
jgi:putative flippase GtrA